ncbi:MAG: hypothetical protein D3903_20895 [Candidatus Electrothrix sp. GM3_4]|nr:hypothetical protein [Candidatus Electrothrix sp. GM3_4]
MGTLDHSQNYYFSTPFFNPISWLLGQKKEQIKYVSSVDKHNLRRLEKHLKKLQSPQWSAVDVLPDIDHESVRRGGELFREKCASCHNGIKRDDTKRKVIANFTRLKDTVIEYTLADGEKTNIVMAKGINTDPVAGLNAVAYKGYSGIAAGQYLTRDVVGNVFMQEQAPVAAILTIAAKNTVATPDTDRIFFSRWAVLIKQLVLNFWDNDVRASAKVGNYDPDTTAKPFNSLLAYKARPLNGIWATAPYLHNGSVPTLYDLLLPKKKPSDPAGQYRPDTFYIGSREFDAQKVGFISDPNRGWKFDTRLPGNDNGGHDRFGEKTFSKQQRLDIVEHMKTL